MKKDIFEYKDYKAYLRAFIQAQPKGGRGLRVAIAEHMQAPVSHVSQVLGGDSHFSFEQAESVNEFLGHTDEEAQYFLLLVQLSRAGTPGLRKRIQMQIKVIQEGRLNLKERLGVKAGLSEEDQTTFYSSWLYGAIHVIVTIPEFQTKEAISRFLGLSLKRTGEILEFLVSTGLIIQKPGGKYDIGTARIHLGSDSPLISKFHTNWRMRAIQSLEKEDTQEDLHYSSVVTVSEEDALKIKALLVKYISEIKQIIKDSPAEGLHSFSVDFFGLP